MVWLKWPEWCTPRHALCALFPSLSLYIKWISFSSLYYMLVVCTVRHYRFYNIASSTYILLVLLLVRNAVRFPFGCMCLYVSILLFFSSHFCVCFCCFFCVSRHIVRLRSIRSSCSVSFCLLLIRTGLLHSDWNRFSPLPVSYKWMCSATGPARVYFVHLYESMYAHIVIYIYFVYVPDVLCVCVSTASIVLVCVRLCVHRLLCRSARGNEIRNRTILWRAGTFENAIGIKYTRPPHEHHLNNPSICGC